jgi:hypothetical protein
MLKYFGFLLLLVVILYGGYYLVTYMQDARNESESSGARATVLALGNLP